MFQVLTYYQQPCAIRQFDVVEAIDTNPVTKKVRMATTEPRYAKKAPAMVVRVVYEETGNGHTPQQS